MYACSPNTRELEAGGFRVPGWGRVLPVTHVRLLVRSQALGNQCIKEPGQSESVWAPLNWEILGESAVFVKLLHVYSWTLLTGLGEAVNRMLSTYHAPSCVPL